MATLENDTSKAIPDPVPSFSGQDVAAMATRTQPDHLSLAKFLPPAKIRLEFGDGFAGELPWSLLEIDSAHLQLTSIQASKSGTELEISEKDGTKLAIDSTAIRLLVDQQFADALQEAAEKLGRELLPPQRLDEIAKQHGPPPLRNCDPKEIPG